MGYKMQMMDCFRLVCECSYKNAKLIISYSIWNLIFFFFVSTARGSGVILLSRHLLQSWSLSKKFSRFFLGDFFLVEIFAKNSRRLVVLRFLTSWFWNCMLSWNFFKVLNSDLSVCQFDIICDWIVLLSIHFKRSLIDFS